METTRTADGPRCSAVSEALGEPLAGTAATARSWLAIEQSGPWGRDALSASHFDADLARDLAARAAGSGVRIVLIRRPGRHPDRHRPVARSVYLAHTVPGRSWLAHAVVADPKELLDLDFARAGSGVRGLLGAEVAESVLLVCTNGRRDVCCAVRGRPIAEAVAAVHGGRVWECTHIGGHRFAPTAVLLPTGYSYGRLTVASATRLLADGPVPPDFTDCRGRSTWSAAGQVAELAVRDHSGVLEPHALTVTSVEEPGTGGWAVLVSHVDGRKWRVAVAERGGAAARQASCGAAPTPSVALAAVSVSGGQHA
jgi:hypothetical protein